MKHLRLSKGLSQEQLAGLSGISTTHLSAFETGRTNPTLYTFARILDALGDPTLARRLDASGLKPLARRRGRTRRE